MHELCYDHGMSIRHPAHNILQSILVMNLLLLLLMICVSSVAFAKPEMALTQEAETLAKQGDQAFKTGDYEAAILYWSAMAQELSSRADINGQITALIKLSDAHQAMGQYADAITVLNTAKQLADRSDDAQKIIIILNNLGSANTAIGQLQLANTYLLQAIEKARASNATGALAATLINKGNLLVHQHKFNSALVAYTESLQLADGSGLISLAAKASVNSVVAAMKMDQVDNIETLFQTARAHVEKTVDNYQKAFHWISLGQVAYGLSRGDINQSLWKSHAYYAFTHAAELGQQIADSRVRSYAKGSLAKLYLDEKRYDEALQLTREAIFTIENMNAADILYRWQWQTARILNAKDETNAAIQAYQQAISTLQPVRQNLAAQPFISSLFREKINPLYLELADLLLRSTDTMTDQNKIQQSLIAARDAMEQLKAAELQDYFKDDCVVALQKKQRSLDVIDEHTAAIYPILLDGRTELLLSLPDGIKRYTIPVARTDITQVVRTFRRNLENRTTREYLPQAQQLYRWLIAPLQSTLIEQHINTLIMVPEQSLRTIPMAALHDGNHFLIERYAVASTPGMHLTDPKAFEPNSIQVLASGLSEAVQGFSPLPYVTEELTGIQKTYGGQVLLDKAFLLDAVQKELKTNPYTIIHIASHGQFKKDTNENFVLTYDKKLSMDELEQLISIGKFRDRPVELLVLSACQTAAGDDRAALGLAGLAIKAGARSAIATLWFINDKASSDLITGFYHQLKENRLSKAKALQQAQIHLIKNTKNTVYQHPYYWSAFLLIGNWL